MSFLKYVVPVVLGLTASPVLAADPANLKAKGPAVATAPVSPWDFAFGAKVMNDYNFRGISQSDRGISGSIYGELRYDWLYAGAAFWTTKLPNQPLGETDLYFGVRPVLGPLNFDFGAMYYWYPNEKLAVAQQLGTQFPSSFWEIYGKVNADLTDFLNVGANVFYAPSWLNSGAPGTYVSGTAKVKLPYDISISGEIGRYFLGTQTNFSTGPGAVVLPSYTYYNIGASYTFKEFATLDLRFHNTDLTEAQCFVNTGDPAGVVGTTPGASKWCGAAFIGTLSFDLQYSKLPLKLN